LSRDNTEAAMHIRILSVAAAAMMASIAAGGAQTIGPGGIPIAPGPSQPRDFTPGGIGPGGVPVAPGPAARDVNIERIGPGGGPLAPGPAGSVGTGPTVQLPTVAPSSRDLAPTTRSKRLKHRGKSKRRMSRGS
jgi:hypothetical protein